jgi:hypothetical protein
MTHEEKKAMVERLKTTNMVFCGLPRNEQEFIEKNLRDCVELDVYGCWTEAEQPIHSCMLLRISPDFHLPEPAIDPPEGYRIVSMEDRKRCKYPVDCEVKFRHKDSPVFVKSTDSVRWQYPLADLYVFAVPTSYVFAEDRPEERWFFCTNSKKIWFQSHDTPKPLGTEWIEITAAQKSYLETKPKAEAGFEWVLKVPVKGDTVKTLYDDILISDCDYYDNEDFNGIRWVKVPVKQEATSSAVQAANHGQHKTLPGS